MYSTDPDVHKGRLTRRQTEFLLLAANGRTNRQIARICHVTVGTVKVVLRVTFIRLGVDSRVHAVAIAIKLNMIDLEAIAIPSPDTTVPRISPTRKTLKMRKPRLTKRQAEILLLTANGKTGTEISQELGITVNTVSEILVSAYRRLGAQGGRAHAVAIALCLNEIDAYDIVVPEAPSRYHRKAAA